MENSILNNLIIDPGIIIIDDDYDYHTLVLQIKNSFKLNRFMKKYKSFMKGKRRNFTGKDYPAEYQ